MPRLIVFNQVTLDGYFAGEHGDLSWAHTSDRPDAEWKAFVEENAKGGDEGRGHPELPQRKSAAALHAGGL